jgi:Flp pilus assembly protein TadG
MGPTMSLRNLRRRRAAGDRGAALVEAAFITPVFALLLFGILEFGLTFRDYLTVANTSRDSARAASAYGDATYADYNIIQVAKQSSKGFRPNEIRKLIVFDAGAVNGSIHNTSHPAHACLTAATGISGVCNIYSSADLYRPKSDFGCGAAEPDRFWCPTTREVRASGPPDYVGVYIQARHDFITGLFGPGMNLTDEIVMRIEPQDF